MKPHNYLFILTLITAFVATDVDAQQAKPKMDTAIPPEIMVPDRVETRIGTLNFFAGMPDKATVKKA